MCIYTYEIDKLTLCLLWLYEALTCVKATVDFLFFNTMTINVLLIRSNVHGITVVVPIVE